MKIAFYAPMKAPDHPHPSGDRTVARSLRRVLEDLGHDVVVASSLRSWDAGDSCRQEGIAREGARECERLRTLWRDEPPDLWFTYHLYHKAPDHLGPSIADAFRIPYVVAEPSLAHRRSRGPWREPWAAALAAIRRADVLLPVTAEDRAGLVAAGVPEERIVPLRPFIADAGPAADRREARLDLASRFGLEPLGTIAAVVAMMRPGDKLASYRVLAEALDRLDRTVPQLLVVGDGPARPEVERLLAGRAILAGQMRDDDIPEILAGCDLFLWPAVNEAYGMAILTAQAAGLAVVAGDVRGVSDIVVDGATGLLVPEGDGAAFAGAVARLLEDSRLVRAFGGAARRRVLERHSSRSAAATVARALALARGARP